MHEPSVQPKAALSIALAMPERVQSPVPVTRSALRTCDVRRLIVAVVHGVDVEALARSADATIVAHSAESRVDVDAAVLLAQRFKIGLAEILQSVVVSL